jgi:demethylmenaquinone methyltransferase/2-methoxy-6-polyprenyl-1,4-benzoquinol methylase
MLKSAHVPPGVTLLLGSAEALPVAANSVDFISMGYALRHVADFTVAFREFMRVLAPGGRICLLEITSPRATLPRALLKAYLRGLVPFVARVFARNQEMPKLMRYYWDTIETCAPPADILAALAEAGFIDAQRTVSLGIFSEYCARKSAA